MVTPPLQPRRLLVGAEEAKAEALVVGPVPRDVDVRRERQRGQAALHRPAGRVLDEHPADPASCVRRVHADLLDVAVAIDDVEDEVGHRPVVRVDGHERAAVDGVGGELLDRAGGVVGDWSMPRVRKISPAARSSSTRCGRSSRRAVRRRGSGIVGGRSAFTSRPVGAGLGLVTAGAHGAPRPRPVLGLVEERPPAVVRGADLQPVPAAVRERPLHGDEQGREATSYAPDRRHQLRLTVAQLEAQRKSVRHSTRAAARRRRRCRPRWPAHWAVRAPRRWRGGGHAGRRAAGGRARGRRARRARSR